MREEAALIDKPVDLNISYARPRLQLNPVCYHIANRIDVRVAGQDQLVCAAEKRTRAHKTHAYIASSYTHPVTQHGTILRVHGEAGGLRIGV